MASKGIHIGVVEIANNARECQRSGGVNIEDVSMGHLMDCKVRVIIRARVRLTM